jgi:hypothetical protein
LSDSAAALAASRYSRESYVRRTAEAYRRLMAGSSGASPSASVHPDAREPGAQDESRAKGFSSR